MAKKKTEASVEEKLRALYDLQLIHSRVDTIRNMRGELPLEVEDLEDEVAGLTKRQEKLHGELGLIDDQIKAKKIQIEESGAAIKKYTEQQKNVKRALPFFLLVVTMTVAQKMTTMVMGLFLPFPPCPRPPLRLRRPHLLPPL